MSPMISRRGFLKISSLALGAGVLPADFLRIIPPAFDQPGAIAVGRVSLASAYIYVEPSLKSERVGTVRRDDLLSLLEEVQSPAGPAHNPLWYRIRQGYIHSGRVQRIDPQPENEPQENIPALGLYGEVTVPYTRVYRYTRAGGWQRLYRLHYGSVHWITALDSGPDGAPWYRLRDTLLGVDYDAPAKHLRVVPSKEFSPTSRQVPPESKRIVISLDDQTLTAYEGEQAALHTRVSTGLPDNAFFNSTGIPTETPRGNFHIQFKTPSRHMGDGRLTEDLDAYELPGVPWTMVFQKDGIALHGVFWHNNFGVRMSHGCVNLPSPDALWLFRWTDPVYTPRDWYVRGMGTLVQVI